MSRVAIGDDDGARGQGERPGPARHVNGPRDHSERGVLDTGNENDEREQVDHAAYDMARRDVQRPVF